MLTIIYYLLYVTLCQMNNLKDLFQYNNAHASLQQQFRTNTIREICTPLRGWSAIVFLFFIAYTATPYLHIGFDAAANQILTLGNWDSALPRTIIHRTLASSCAIAYFGLLYCISQCLKKKLNLHTLESLTTKRFLYQFLFALVILALCGLSAAIVEGLYMQSNGHSVQRDSLQLRTTNLGLITLVIDTTILAFKEELIYRAIPSFVLSTLFFPELTNRSQVSNSSRTYPRGLFIILVLFSIPFAIAHTGIGTMFGSLLAGTAFLFMIITKQYRWWILALAHAVYNFLVLMNVPVA